ncbi:uncharacterized protein LOC141612164 [Silene latifolia]|uniref:uncharacterized protein LOC141612164 n=1 Tax=Silene latifolia TaxID=37657 RepID=UPI003D772DB5
MIGSFLTRGLVMILGYMYPAYECFKTVERNKPEIEQLRFWCQYWILVAVMTVFERVGDTFVSWVPMYSEAKLAFIIYLWYPRTKGTTYVYDSFFKPYVTKHETEIDRNLMEIRTRAGDMAFMYCQKAVIYGQTRIFEVLQYVAAQSTPRPRPTQAEQQAPRVRQASVTAAAAAAPPPRQPASRVQATPPQPESEPKPEPQPQVEEPLSPTSSTTSSSLQVDKIEDEQSSSQDTSSASTPPLPAPSPIKKSISLPIAPASPRRPVANKSDLKQTAATSSKTEKPAPKSPPPPPQDTVMEDAIRVTRGRLRKTRSAATK